MHIAHFPSKNQSEMRPRMFLIGEKCAIHLAGCSMAVSLLSVPGVGRSGLHTAGSSRWVELALHTPTHRSLSKKSSFTFVYLLEDTHCWMSVLFVYVSGPAVTVKSNTVKGLTNIIGFQLVENLKHIYHMTWYVCTICICKSWYKNYFSMNE